MEFIWIWLRRAFLALMWLGVIIAGLVIWALWKIIPGEILGVGWIWAAVPAWVALVLVALDAVLEISPMPLPPHIPPQHEIAQWMLFIIMSPLVAGIFALDVWILVVIEHFVRELISWLPLGAQQTVLGAICVAWFMGTFWVLARVADSPWTDRFRCNLRYRLLGLHTSEAQILSLLNALDLPDEVKAPLVWQIRRKGLNSKTVYKLLEALEAHPAVKSRVKGAMLAQSLYNWLDEHQSYCADR